MSSSPKDEKGKGAAKPASFKYESLPEPDGSIRLLEIVPGEESSALHCKLSIRNLAQVPRYAAISYNWGAAPSKSNPGRTISIDGKATTVRENCYQALYQVRLNLYHLLGLRLKYIWIDSICINQKDLKEKAAQVQIMASHIYPSASSVFISLGSESAKIQDFLQDLTRMDLEGLLSQETSTEDLGIGKAFDACIEIGHRPYWKRLWVLPEILTAKDLQILCGSHLIRWRVLRTFLDLPQIVNSRKRGTADFEKVWSTPLGRVYRTKDAIGSQIELFQLENLLQSHADWECENPRDRFYAFWSMLNWPKGADKLKVDYEIPKIELARHVLRLISCQGRARNLSHVCSSISNFLTVFSVSASDLKRYGLLAEGKSASKSAPSATDWARPIYVDLSNHIVATLNTGESSKMTVEACALDTPIQSSHKVTNPSNSITCLPLFWKSLSIGWLCPDAHEGDLLMKFEVEGYKLYLVVRPQGLRNPTSLFNIIGQAIIDPTFDIVADHNKKSLGNFAYCCMATSDLVNLVTPILISRSNDAKHSTQHTRLTQAWPYRKDLSLIYISPVLLDGAGHEIRGCVSCGASDSITLTAERLSCGHRMCAACLKREFEESIQDWMRMPPKCCTDEHIPLQRVNHMFDVAFKQRWNRTYQEAHTKDRIYCSNTECGNWIKPTHVRIVQGWEIAQCPRCDTEVCKRCKKDSRKSCICRRETGANGKHMIDPALDSL